ncbi:MAG TPA: hypothetical protein DDW68_05120 [Verrucomicrobiales bacterium]|nr:hypothetical protein [Verrucomicrobiales bacterium]
MKAIIKRLIAPITPASIGFLLVASTASATADNELCPIMIEDEIDEEAVFEFAGKKVYLCCDKCEDMWAKRAKYFIKSSPDLLPQFKGMEKELELDKVELLPQKFCPIYTSHIITPDSPSLEVDGEKVYFWTKTAIRRWNRNAKGSLKKALAGGYLPQFSENKKVAGKANPVKKAEK